jgi:hypothetical protein
MNINVARLPLPAILFGLAAIVALGVGLGGAGAVAVSQDDGFEDLIGQRGDGTYHKGGWNHYGPGYFELDEDSGVLASHGGMGLFWYSARKYSDFELELEFKTSKIESNSGVFVRVPGMPSSDAYIFHSFEIQIYDATAEGVHQSGAVYDAEPSTHVASKPTGEWNKFRIRFVGDQITVWLNREQVLDWAAEPRGKVEDFASAGYIGLQNHDHDSSVYFRNIRVKDLSRDS